MNNEMTVAQKRAMRRAEFNRKFGQYWFIYLALFGTAALSVVSGLMLPFSPDKNGYVVLSIGGVLAAVYYSIGFLTTGEGASYFWFDKLTDHDPDNTIQKGIAGLMLTLSISTSLVTALAAGAFIAFWLGIFDAFYVMPTWAQKWVVWAIPTMWVLHFIGGALFRYLSEESEYEREAASSIRTAKNEMVKSKSKAKADYWKANAPALARQLGEMEAEDELDAYHAKLEERKTRRGGGGQNQQSRQFQPTQPTVNYNQDVSTVGKGENGQHEPGFTNRPGS